MASASNTLDQVRSIRYDFDASFLTKQTIGTTLLFTADDNEVRTWGAWVGGDGAVHACASRGLQYGFCVCTDELHGCMLAPILTQVYLNHRLPIVLGHQGWCEACTQPALHVGITSMTRPVSFDTA